MIQNEKILRSTKLAHSVPIEFVKMFTRTEDFLTQPPYWELFPSKINSDLDTVLIKQIEKMTETMAEAPFSHSNHPYSLTVVPSVAKWRQVQ